MASTHTRSFVKGVSWEFFSLILTTAVIYLFYGNLYKSFSFSFGLSIIKIILFFGHERLWKKIRWGKYHVVKGKRVRG